MCGEKWGGGGRRGGFIALIVKTFTYLPPLTLFSQYSNFERKFFSRIFEILLQHKVYFFWTVNFIKIVI